MEVYATDEQQWEAIKNFFKKYGNRLLWAGIIIMASISAVRYWQHHQYNQRVASSELYSEVLMSYEQKDYVALNTKTQSLKENFAKTPYATLASMLAGKVAYKEGENEVAKQNYTWAIDHSPNPEFKRLAQFRLMKLLMLQGGLETALNIAKQDQDGLMPLFRELEGDFWLQKNDLERAKIAYQAAASATKTELRSPLLKLKLENLGVEVE